VVFARSRRADADRAEADVLLVAVTWAEQHPPESSDAAATWIAGGGAETGIPLAGEGAPLVAEFCVAEVALAIGRSTDSGRSPMRRCAEPGSFLGSSPHGYQFLRDHTGTADDATPERPPPRTADPPHLC
jgi:hypothetical protein